MKSGSPQNILMVSEYYAPHWTGIVKSFHQLALNLHQQGHKIDILATQHDPTLPNKETENGITITRVPYQFRISRTHYSFSIVIIFAKMLMKYDAALINSPNSNILFYTIIAKLLRKKVYIYHQGDIKMPRMTGNRITGWILERIFDVMTIPALRMADIVSTFTRDYAEHSRVMKYDLEHFQAYIPRLRLPKEKPTKAFKAKIDTLKKKHTMLGISGRFVEEKAFDVLFQALPLILKEYPDAHLVFAGKKIMDYEPYYEKYSHIFKKYEKHVTYLGFLDAGDLRYFYENLDVFILSSRSECFALTQIEAWECNVPIVVTDIPGARMFVKTSGFGTVVKPESKKSIAQGVIEILKNKNKYLKNYSKAQTFLNTYENFTITS